jgi:biotin operon repressor
MKKIVDDWYSLKEVAALLGITVNTLHRKLAILKYKKPDDKDIPINDNEKYRLPGDRRIWKKSTIDNYLKKELKNDN